MRADNWEIVGHGRGVAGHAARLGRELGFDPRSLASLRLAALLHDIGKLAVPERILGKPEALSPSEWAQIRSHPTVGARMLAAEGLEEIAGWVRAHHERPDGLGYPDGLRGDVIPIEARILAVADAYDAMVTDRPYSSAISPGEARARNPRGPERWRNRGRWHRDSRRGRGSHRAGWIDCREGRGCGGARPRDRHRRARDWRPRNGVGCDARRRS